MLKQQRYATSTFAIVFIDVEPRSMRKRCLFTIRNSILDAIAVVVIAFDQTSASWKVTETFFLSGVHNNAGHGRWHELRKPSWTNSSCDISVSRTSQSRGYLFWRGKQQSIFPMFLFLQEWFQLTLFSGSGISSTTGSPKATRSDIARLPCRRREIENIALRTSVSLSRQSILMPASREVSVAFSSTSCLRSLSSPPKTKSIMSKHLYTIPLCKLFVHRQGPLG